MNMSPVTILAVISVLATHFIADFYCQSDEMAEGKSSSNYWLGRHILVYTLIMTIFALPLLAAGAGLLGIFLWLALNSAAHAVTDYHTSRWSARLHGAGRRHDFFVVVGFDQLIHQVTLVTTLPLLLLA